MLLGVVEEEAPSIVGAGCLRKRVLDEARICCSRDMDGITVSVLDCASWLCSERISICGQMYHWRLETIQLNARISSQVSGFMSMLVWIPSSSYSA